MGLDLNYVDNGQTPLDDDEKDGLLISTITTRGDLDEFEQQNIEKAIEWSLKKSLKPEIFLTENFIKNLHKRMYSEVWDWAGEFRKTNKNIGVDKWQIAVELRNLLDDTKLWLHNNTYESDELVIRFKYRLATIHCFANGNGRHSRLMADILIKRIFHQPVFTWGAANLTKQGETRITYINAMRQADRGNIKPLLEFARS